MDAVINVAGVEKQETKRGNTRYVLRDDENHEYVTFRPPLGKEAEAYRGKPAHIEFHEERRGDYKNVYLDKISPPDAADAAGPDDALDADIVGWQVAAEVAPLIVDDVSSPDETFERLKQFKDRVAADILGKRDDESES